MTIFASVFSGKGGVGKSTLNCLLADVLSYSKILEEKKKRRAKILVLDMDDQSSAASYILGEETVAEMGKSKRSLPDIISDLDNFSNFKNLFPKLIEKRNRSITRELEIGEVDVIHSINDDKILNYLHNSDEKKIIKTAKNLKKYLSDLYDFVFIDIPGSNIPNNYSFIGLLLAEHYFLVTSCSAMEVFSLPKTFELLKKISKLKSNNFDHHIHGAILNMVDRRSLTYKKRKDEILGIMQSYTKSKFYDQPLANNASVQSIGVVNGKSFKEVWRTYKDKVRLLAEEIISDIGYNAKKGIAEKRN